MQVRALQTHSLPQNTRVAYDSDKGVFANTPNFKSNSAEFPLANNTAVHALKPLTISMNKKFTPLLVSFKGCLGKNPTQIALVGAEFDPYSRVGGVATVMRDYYEIFNECEDKHKKNYGDARVFIPYYNGAIERDRNGNPTGYATVLMKDGCPIYTGKDLSKVKIDELKPGDYWELEEITRKEAIICNSKEDIRLYKVKNKNHYMVFTKITAKMKAPYQTEKGKNIAYSSTFSKEAAEYLGDPYARFNKALVELLPSLEDYSFAPAHIICSDPQSAYLPEYIMQKTLEGDPYFEGVKPSYVMHNLGRGYQGIMSARDMFFNLADIDAMDFASRDPAYLEALRDGNGDDYFKRFFPDLVDESGQTNASMIPIRYAEKRYLTYMNTVSEEYAQSAVKNGEVASGIQQHLQEGLENGWFGGILNGFEDKRFYPQYPLDEFKLYAEKCTDEATGITHLPFKTFSADMSYEKIADIKRQNAINLLQRLVENADPQYAVGKENVKCDIIGSIDKTWIEALKKKSKVNLFVSWGRGDYQKGHDITLSAFEKFAKTPEGKNAVLVMGGKLLPKTEDYIKIKSILARMQTDKDLRGRFVYMDGFIPNKPVISAATASILPSRFAPCELTDLESMRFGTTPIVINHQGLAQKNFDPRTDTKFPPTSYKTTHEYYITDEELEKCSKGLRKEVKELVEAERLRLDILEVCPLEDPDSKKIATENIKNSEIFFELQKKWKDDLLASEIADCMKAKATEPLSLRAKMTYNALNLQSSWANNNLLHPSQKSSKEMYIKYHLNTDSKMPEKSLFVKGPFKKPFEFLRINYSHLRLRRFLLSRYLHVSILAAALTGAGIAFAKMDEKKKALIKQNEDEKRLETPPPPKSTMHLIKEALNKFPKEFTNS